VGARRGAIRRHSAEQNFTGRPRPLRTVSKPTPHAAHVSARTTGTIGAALRFGLMRARRVACRHVSEQ
jgi:hypothetical protein